MPYPEIHAAVLAGGKSRRFGSDKCLAHLSGDGLTYLQRVILACREVAERVVIIGHGRPGLMGIADGVIGDLAADGGPLIGLQTALQDCSAPYLLLAACDQPFLTPVVLEQLANRRFDADVIAFMSESGRTDPFPSLMRSATIRRLVDERIRANDRSLMSIFAGPARISVVTIEAGFAERAALRDVDFVGDAL